MSIADPLGGTFDAAGDFDRFIDDNSTFPVLGSLDPYADTTMTAAMMPPLIADIAPPSLKPRRDPRLEDCSAYACSLTGASKTETCS